MMTNLMDDEIPVLIALSCHASLVAPFRFWLSTPSGVVVVYGQNMLFNAMVLTHTLVAKGMNAFLILFLRRAD